MPYQINTNSSFIIDGNEQNAGERVFIRDARVHVIDGSEAGTAAIREFLRDSRLFVLGGGVNTDDVQRITYTANYAVEGHAQYGAALCIGSLAFVLDGNCPPLGPLAMRSTSFFTVEAVPQEATP